MDIMKREIKIFISVVLLMLVGASAVFAATKDDIVEPLRVHNEGFEEPVVTNNNKYDQLDMGKVPYWQSTAFEGKIELFIKNTGTYIKPNVTLVPRAGSQAAELNADEASTLYQYVYGAPGSVYEWGVSHRARYDADDNNKGDKDTMAIFIGPKQPVDPAKTAKGGKDQFMKTVDWLNDNKLLDLNVADLDYGDCRAFEVFTTKFAEGGTFEGGDDNAISLTQTDTHTEKWHVWIVVSSKDSWYDYGVTAAEDCAMYGGGDKYKELNEKINSSYPNDTVPIKYKMPDYNYQYTVPATSTEGTIYAYCAYDTASPDSSKPLTYGNMVDYARMGILSPVRVTSTEGGSTDVTLNTMSAVVTSDNQFSTETAAGNAMSLVIKPGIDKGNL